MLSTPPDPGTPVPPEPRPDPSSPREGDTRALSHRGDGPAEGPRAGERAGPTESSPTWIPEVYQQLRAAAALQMRGERDDHTLEPTALVHEAFIKLALGRRVPWRNRQHFYVAAAEAMRQILLDHARARGRQKRGGGWQQVPLSLADVARSWDLEEIVSLDDALRRLEGEGPEIAAVVRLRFFAGLSIDEAAEALEVSPATVKRRWEFGRTWLYRALRGEGRTDGD